MTLGKRDVAMSKQAMLPRFLLCPLLEAENVNKLWFDDIIHLW
jgi:hypothetical protein